MNLNSDQVPDCLALAISLVTAGLSAEEKELFRTTPKENLDQLHFNLGIQLRNDWSLWDEKTPLRKHFLKLGINHPDDVAQLVIESVWRVLNNMPLEIEDQVRSYQLHWKALLGREVP